MLIQDQETEDLVIAHLINHYPSFYDCEDIISSEDVFYHAQNLTIYQIIKELNEAGHEATFAKCCITIRTKNLSSEKSLMKHLAKLKELTTFTNDFLSACYYLETLYRERETKNKCQKIIEAIDKRSGFANIKVSTDELSNFAEKGYKSKNITSANQAIAKSLDKLNSDTQNSGIKTGIDTLDKFTGGWQSSELIVIAGRPAMGKTIAGVHHAIAAAKSNVPVAYITFEMESYRIINRVLSSETGVPYKFINQNNLSTNQRESVIDSGKLLSNLPLYFYEYNLSRDISDVVSTMKFWRRKFGIGLIVIDYIQLIRDKSVKSSDETTIITNVSMKIKQLQAQLNIPIIALAQLSRANESRSDKRPNLSDLRSSGQIEQDASVVIGLYRDDYYNRLKHEENGANGQFIPENTIEYLFLKNRDGETGAILMSCKPEIAQISTLKTTL